jgi:GNAT superfamily N-acetyltransferase
MTLPHPHVRPLAAADVDAALEALVEVARWTERFGEPVWDAASFTHAEHVALAAAGELVGGFEGERLVACMRLQAADPLWWPEDPPGEALYLHKVVVRREAAGRGWLGRLLAWAAAEGRRRGVRALRLDTLADTPLPEMYARHGFRPADPAPLRTARDPRPITRMQRFLE